MENVEVLNNLTKNIKDIEKIEEDISMIKLAIYKKNIERLKKEKAEEIQKYFKDQFSYYGQNIDDYKDKIDSTIKEYIDQMNKLEEAYDYLYINVFQNIYKAINNQNIAIANIVTTCRKRENKTEEEIKEINKTIIALAEKKLNYSVIYEESKARLDWCIENAMLDMEDIFQNKNYQMVVYQNGFWAKLKRKILNMINGKNKALNIIEKYNNESLRKIKKENKNRVIYTLAVANGFLEQVSKMEKQIAVKYAEAA